MTILVLIAIWCAIGVAGFLFWWTTEHDFTAGDLFAAVLASFTGPFAWLIGWSIHGERGNVIIHKRGDK